MSHSSARSEASVAVPMAVASQSSFRSDPRLGFSLYGAAVYFVTLFFFALAGLVLAVLGLVTRMLPLSRARERIFQRLIAWLFAILIGWMRCSRVCRVEYRGFERVPSRPLVMVANHPGLLDATYLLARIPRAVCIFKESLRRNPVLGAARQAGYLANDGGLGLVRAATAKIAGGATLVVFPEGTRTPPGGSLGAFQSGFALIARRAAVPIQLIRITSSQDLLVKGRPWWKAPRLPAAVVVQAGPLIEPRSASSTAALVAQIEAWYRADPFSPSPDRAVAPIFASQVQTLTA